MTLAQTVIRGAFEAHEAGERTDTAPGAQTAIMRPLKPAHVYLHMGMEGMFEVV